MKALLFKPDNDAPESVELQNFAAIKKAIGGGHVCIAEIYPPTEEGFDLLCCDEDGEAKNMVINNSATHAASWPYPLLGAVVVCKRSDFMAQD